MSDDRRNEAPAPKPIDPFESVVEESFETAPPVDPERDGLLRPKPDPVPLGRDASRTGDGTSAPSVQPSIRPFPKAPAPPADTEPHGWTRAPVDDGSPVDHGDAPPSLRGKPGGDVGEFPTTVPHWDDNSGTRPPELDGAEPSKRRGGVLAPGPDNIRLVYLMNLIVFVPIVPIASAVIAYLNRREADEMLESHYTYAMRSVLFLTLVGGAAWIAGLPPYGPVTIAIMVWYVLRNMRGMGRLGANLPIENPNTLLI